MKRKILLLVTACILICLNTLQVTAKDRSYDGTIRVETERLDQRGEMLHINLNIILENLKLKSPNGVDLIPVLVSPARSYTLPMVSLKGKNEYLVYERKLSLMSKKQVAALDKPYLVEKSSKRRNDTLEYNYVLPYEPWMAEARLDMQYDLCGCGETALMEVVPVGKVSLEPVPYTVVPHMAYVQPEAETVKRREVQAEAFLDFEVNKVNIRPEYMNNPRELAKIYRMIDELKTDPGIEVNRLDIIGYASPEGSLEGNKRLSEGRAKALRDYLAGQYEFPRGLYHIVFGGENWKGLAQALDSLKPAYRNEAMEILENTFLSNDERKTRLKKLHGGAPYNELLKNVYPKLRVAICKVEYSVKNFNVDEAKEIIKTRPQNLSLNEMFLVANTYPEGSQEFIDVFETAVRMFPENGVANLNAAISALSYHNLSAAERYLQRVNPQDHPAEYNNALGVMALLKEDFENAEKYLETASRYGSEAAKQNLEELNKKKASIDTFKNTEKK